jgi:hypothetical protein
MDARHASSDRDIAEAANLINRAIGPSTSARELYRIAAGSHGCVVVIDAAPTILQRMTGVYPRIGGVAVLSTAEPAIFSRGPISLRERLPERFANFNFLAIDPGLRSLGASRALIQPAFRWALGQSLAWAVAASWLRQRAVTSADLLTSAGFSSIGAMPMTSLLPFRVCPPCGGYQCQCQAALYSRAFDEAAVSAYAPTVSPRRRFGLSGIDELIE